MKRISRRRFFAQTAAASAFALGGPIRAGAILGANERIRVAVAGINGRGGDHIKEFAKIEGVEVACLVDPDSRLFKSRSATVADLAGNTPACVQDIRKALEDKDLQAVSVAAPNHWHSLISLWAIQAGKDVYVEKPMSHNVFEGRKVVEAARKYKRIVQHGTQQRSSEGRAREMAAIHSGQYGKLLVSKAYCCKPRWSIDKKPHEDPPAGLDFDLWLGPAQKQPYHKNLVHYNWHWFWDFGDGDTGNQGVHEMDVARWAIKGATLPKAVWSLGGRFGYEDQGQTPNTQLCVFDYGESQIVFETRGLVGKHKDYPNKVSNEFYTSEGVIRGGRFYPNSDPEKGEALKGPEVKVTPGGAFGSFIACVRSRKVEEVNAESIEAHYSSALCHLGNISWRLGEKAPFDRNARAFGDNKQVYESLMAIEDNLVKGVGLKIEEQVFQVGPRLSFDAAAECFVDSPKADALLTRDYRAPFIVPREI